MEVRAVTKFTGISAQKTRLVLDEMRGRRAEDAMALLQFMPQPSAVVIAKTIKSAMANAVENYGYDAGDMVITKIYADAAPIRKWRRFGARGRFKPWRRPSSHVTVVLEEKTTEAAPAPKAAAKATAEKPTAAKPNAAKPNAAKSGTAAKSGKAKSATVTKSAGK